MFLLTAWILATNIGSCTICNCHIVLLSELPFGSFGIHSHRILPVSLTKPFQALFKPWLKSALQYCLHCLWHNLTFSPIVPLMSSLAQVLQSPKPKTSTYLHHGNSRCIYKLCEMRTTHLHSSTCSGNKITILTLLLQLIPRKESIQTVYYQKYSLTVSRAEIPKQDCHVVLSDWFSTYSSST